MKTFLTALIVGAIFYLCATQTIQLMALDEIRDSLSQEEIKDE